MHGIIGDLDVLVEIRAEETHDRAVYLDAEITGHEHDRQYDVPCHAKAQTDADIAAHAGENHFLFGVAVLCNVGGHKVEIHTDREVKLPGRAAQTHGAERFSLRLGVQRGFLIHIYHV